MGTNESEWGRRRESKPTHAVTNFYELSAADPV